MLGRPGDGRVMPKPLCKLVSHRVRLQTNLQPLRGPRTSATAQFPLG
jgi:hypothetical protein